jgi:transposase
MPIRRSPNGVRHVRPQPGRNRPEWVVAINRNARSQSVGTGGRNHPVRARWIVERTIAWLNRCRRLAKDWENLNRNALAFLKLASIRLMLRKLCNPC